MPTTYQAAVLELHQLAPEAFVNERKRLAAALKAQGLKEDAQRLAKLQRPTVSVWLVNQLYSRERALFDRLFATAAALRSGDLRSAAAHREVLVTLRQRALAILAEAGRPAQEAVIRKVTTTLSALAATGDFAPDLPGALTTDREPVGFDAAMSVAATASPASTVEPSDAPSVDPPTGDAHDTSATPHSGDAQALPSRDKPNAPDHSAAAHNSEREELALKREEFEHERAASEAARIREEAQVRHAAERSRLEADLHEAEAAVKEHEKAMARQRAELEHLESELVRQRGELESLESELERARKAAVAAAERFATFDATSHD
jgi:hypothetical protein